MEIFGRKKILKEQLKYIGRKKRKSFIDYFVIYVSMIPNI